VNIRRFWLASLVLLMLIGGCVPGASQTVENPQDMIATIAAATVAALPTNTPQPTWTASLTPTRARSTPTDQPANTPAPTLELIASPTSMYELPGPGTLLPGTPGQGGILFFWTSTPEPYKCDLNKTQPEPYTVFRGRKDFRAEWRVWNRGSAIWKADGVVFYFVGGTKLHRDEERADGIFLPYTVYPEDKVLLSVAMISPKEPGIYSATWGLRRENRDVPFCTFDVIIRVK
jgi:hypothetical protein